jgi:hypothetical protein
MKMFSIGNQLTPYLLAASTLLLGVLAIESRNLVQPQVDSSPAARPEVNTFKRTNFSAPGVAAFSEITERPLFREGREPPSEPIEAAVTAKQSPLRLQLEGVALTPTEKIAVLRDISTNKMMHLAVGNKHQDWELTSVTDTVATFKRGAQSLELTLKPKKK